MDIYIKGYVTCGSCGQEFEIKMSLHRPRLEGDAYYPGAEAEHYIIDTPGFEGKICPHCDAYQKG